LRRRQLGRDRTVGPRRDVGDGAVHRREYGHHPAGSAPFRELDRTRGRGLLGRSTAHRTGGPSAGSPFAVTYLIDSEQDRTFNNPLPSTVICLLQDPGGQTLIGSARR
jgi:hypothetical protein